MRQKDFQGVDKLLPKKYRLRENSDFKRIYKTSHSISDSNLVLYYRKNNRSNTRLGFSISKKIGKAHERNLLKRQMREIARKNINNLLPGFDLIFIARQKIKGKSYHDVEKSMVYLFNKGRLINDK